MKTDKHTTACHQLENEMADDKHAVSCHLQPTDLGNYGISIEQICN